MRFENPIVVNQIDYGDLPSVEYLLNIYGDFERVKSEIYEGYRKWGTLNEAKNAEEKFKRGLERCKKDFEEFEIYLRKNLYSAGIEIPKKKFEIKDYLIIPVSLPSQTTQVITPGKVLYGEKKAVAANAERNVFLVDLALKDVDEESLYSIALHELAHAYLSQIGVSDYIQKKLEPLIDKSIVEFYESRGLKEKAEKFKKTSGYLNTPSYVV